jgi:prepilin-type N-terminal cleavage/methylation domain-containing protein
MQNQHEMINTSERDAATCQDPGAKICHFDRFPVSAQKNKRNNNQRGFSLIELLIVVIVIGVISAMAVPAFQKGMIAAENATTFATMRTISSTEMSFYTARGRFGRLIEMNNLLSDSIGIQTGDQIRRGKFMFAMSPAAPSDAELRDRYTITATRSVTGEGVVYVYELTQSGAVTQVLP